MSPTLRTAAAVADRTAAPCPTGEPAAGRLSVPRNAGSDWLRTMMQEAASSVAARLANGPAQLVAVSKIAFAQELAAGDMLRCDVEDMRYGATSMSLRLGVWLEEGDAPSRVTLADYTFIAVDANGRPRPVHEPAGGLGGGA